MRTQPTRSTLALAPERGAWRQRESGGGSFGGHGSGSTRRTREDLPEHRQAGVYGSTVTCGAPKSASTVVAQSEPTSADERTVVLVPFVRLLGTLFVTPAR